ncbi:hypothetical protein EST38_g14348 [Candolleomyces aberdarensis]|uniref:Uncharacterized protein n=1 Tax=Candolleomyces aberdarensis TaxID=2316362 RepID=A0A4V1Q1G5_9AGAR|nr:hypothetical protein EST38_g14348 [Candolleomyces aberdarensis]
MADNTIPLAQLLNRPATLYVKRLMIVGDPLAVGLGEMTFPNVTSVVINCESWGWNTTPKLPDLPSLPNVTKAIFANISHDEYFPLHIPWFQLTHLFLGLSLPPGQWTAIFKLCVSLQRGCFHLTSEGEDLEPPVSQSPVPEEATLSQLTELAFLNSGVTTESLRGVTMPALTKLQVFSRWNGVTWDLAHPERYTNLTHLTFITCSFIQAEDLIPIFKTVPHLTELFFKISYHFEEVFKYLTIGCDGKFNLRAVKALGIYMYTERYRTLELGEEDAAQEFGDSDPLLPFPYRAFEDLVASRTQAVHRGDFSSVPYTITPLQHLVIRMDDNDWAKDIARTIREDIQSFSIYGLTVGVFGPEELQGRQCLGGEAPWPLIYKHWDEGFMGFVDDLEEYSLYTKATPNLGTEP